MTEDSPVYNERQRLLADLQRATGINPYSTSKNTDTLAFLEATADALLSGQLKIAVRVDRRATCRTVNELMEALAKAGITKVRLGVHTGE